MNDKKICKGIKAVIERFSSHDDGLNVLAQTIPRILRQKDAAGATMYGNGFKIVIELDDEPCDCAKCVAKRAIEKAGA
jgi:hypothetical protein